MAAQYCADDDDLGTMLFPDDIVLCRVQITSAAVTSDTWDKLQAMYKEGGSGYRIAQSEYTRSGTHQRSFYGACEGQLLPYYTNKILETKPGLGKVVSANLPSSVKGDSMQPATSGATSRRRSDVGDKRKGAPYDVEEMAASLCPPELADEKVKYLQGQRQYTEKRSRYEDEAKAVRDREAGLEARAVAHRQWVEACPH
eukprot:GHVU01156439.1.p2 GENE.GHVU01156439.1~~GHVU01156439.1.p2  ORF type:complete len:199 (-),score=31.76 GHVU01156439.1:21-617(-)